MTYNAFISYSHAVDETIATALQKSLHSFAKPWYKLRALHIFRDQTNLAVNPALWSSIRDGLDQSLFFILLASPEAAASPWVAKEAEYWVNTNGSSHVLIVLTGGTLEWDHLSPSFTSDTNALPSSLLRCFSEEPLYLDLRWARSGTQLRLREPRFHEAVLQLAATLHNRPKDELEGADKRIRRQNRLMAVFAVVAILISSLFAVHQTRISREESVRNLAASLAASSAKVLADNPDQAREAALLAIESNRLNPSFEGNQALRAAVALLPAGAQLYSPPESSPDERIRDMAFSSGGSFLALGRDNGSTQVINVVSHNVVGYFAPDEQPVANLELAVKAQSDTEGAAPTVSVAFDSSDSLLAAGARDGLAHVWELRDGREVLRISHGAPVSQLAFRPRTGQLATATDDGHVRIFNIGRAAMLADFLCPGKVVALSFSPAGDLLAALSSEGMVSVFDAVQLRTLRTLPGGEAAFNLAFSNSGKRLAAANGDFAFVWDVTSGRQLLKATHANSSETLTPQQWIYNAAISPDGTLLAYAARGDNLAHVWNIETGRQVLELKHDFAVAAVSFNADGTKLGTGSYDGTARVWELPSGRELERGSLGGGAEVVVFSPNGRHFAAGGVEGSVLVSELSRADRPASFNLPGDVRSVAFSPDGQRLAIGTTSEHWSPLVRIADIRGNILSDIEFQGAPVIDKLFFPDRNKLIAQWSDKLFLINLEPSSTTPLPGVPADMRIDPSGKTLASQRDGVTRLYALPELRQITSIGGPSSTLLRIAREGKLLAFETNRPPNEFAIEVWSAERKTRITRISLPAELTRIAINLSGTTVFTAEGERLQAWDAATGKQHFSLTASGDIDVIVPDPSSTAVATLTHGRLTVWDAVLGTRLAQLPDTGYLYAAVFSPNGRELLTGYKEREASLWLWRSDDLRDQACSRLTRNFSHKEWERWFPKQRYRQTCPRLPAAD